MVVYRGPGVFSEEIVTSIAPSPIAEENVVAIVSEVPGTTPFREIITLSGTDDVQLQKLGINPASLQIKSRDEYTTYVVADDYIATQSSTNEYMATTTVSREVNAATETFTLSDSNPSYTPVNARGVHNIVISTTTPARTYQEYVDYTYDPYSRKITRVTGSSLPNDGTTTITIAYNYGIEDGEVVIAEYRYADEDYYAHQLFGDYSEVRAIFGDAWKSDGNPNPVSLAASMVFANGGPDTQVMVIPVNPHSTDTPGDPNDTVNLANWQLAIEDIVEDEISMVIETSGLVEVHAFVIQNTLGAANYNQSRMALLGRDKTKQPTLTRQNLRDYAEAINNQRVVVVSPAEWETLDTIGGDIKKVGGQYAAAALAGLLTNIRIQDTPTRRPIAGIRTPAPEREILLNGDSAAGLCVIENRKGFMRVRHGLTTAFANINTREISVVRAKDFVIKSMKEVLDRSVIGMLMEPDVDFLVASAATSILDRMKEGYVIAEYEQPQVYQDATDPTRLLLRFNYLPNYPVNEILIQFSISPLGTTVIQ